MDESILEILVDIQSSIRSIQDQLNEKSNPVHRIHQTDDDLIDQFFNECLKRGIEEKDLPVDYDSEDLKNRASFYFKNIGKIASPRAYLLKILSQIPGKKQDDQTEISAAHPESEIDEIEKLSLLEEFSKLTDEQIQKVIFDNERVMWSVNGVPREKWGTYQKVLIAHCAKKVGLV